MKLLVVGVIVACAGAGLGCSANKDSVATPPTSVPIGGGADSSTGATNGGGAGSGSVTSGGSSGGAAGSGSASDADGGGDETDS